MFKTSTITGLVAALATAGSVTVQAAPREAAAVALRSQASAQMRLAQVELYCDHPGEALAAIRRATHQLEQPSDVAASHELATLERAAWHVRRRETGAAVAALDLAITRLAA